MMRITPSNLVRVRDYHVNEDRHLNIQTELSRKSESRLPDPVLARLVWSNTAS